MNVLPCVIRGALNISLCTLFACFLMGPQSLVPNYFANKGPLLLEDFKNDGQAKAKFAGIFSPSGDPHWYRRDTKIISKLIGLRVDPNYWSPKKVHEISQYILFMSYTHKVPVSLILSLIEVESGFAPKAVSHKGATGIMQLMPATAEDLAKRNGLDWYGPATLEDPKRNIEFALHYLSELRARFQRTDLTLVAYNMGPTALMRKIKNGEKIPQGYYRKVISTMKIYQSQIRAPITASAGGEMKWL